MVIQLRPSVATQPMQSQAGGINGRVEPVRDSSSNAMLAIGTGLQQLGQATTAVADQYQDQIDVAQSLRMRNLYSVEVDNALQDPEKGFLSTVGKDANNERRKQSFDAIAERRRKIEAIGQNNAQRLNFTSYADRQDAESRQRADIHQEREAKHFLAGELKVASERDIERAATLQGTDKGEAARLDAIASINKRADLFGWPADSAQRKALVQGGTDAIHSMVIDKYLQDPMGAPEAARYLAEHRGEMSQNVLGKAVDDVRRAVKIGQQQMVDSVAWNVASNLSTLNLSIDEQLARINWMVTDKQEPLPVEIAMRAWSFAQNFDDQKWKGRQRDIASTKQELEQAFAKDENLDVVSLDAEWSDRIDRLFLRSDAWKIHTDVRLKRTADQIGEGSIESLALSRDVRSMGDLTRLSEILEKRKGDIQGDELRSPQGKEKVKRIDKQILWIGQTIDALSAGLANRSYVMPEDTIGGAPGFPSAPNTASPPATDMRKFAESIRKTLYPGAK